MSATLIAIDPGMSGGVAWIREGIAGACKMPPEDELNDLFFTLGPIRAVYIEDIPYAFSRGTKVNMASLAKLHRNTGRCEGIVIGRQIRLVSVKPYDWQKKLNIGNKREAGGYEAWKRVLKSEAARRFPDLTVTLDTADALLILEYARGVEVGSAI